MKYPCLVPRRLCKTEIYVTLYREGLSESGAPLAAEELVLLCNYQDSAKMVMDAEQKLVQLSGVAMLPGDICPGLPAISGGTAIVHGAERAIMRGIKARNPDGTVNYTELRLV